ncbi:MAG: hypothetical protein J6X55_18045, partial [Victivallales bacterium]|nr:hypothetical protein [Victivallales bacterium]
KAMERYSTQVSSHADGIIRGMVTITTIYTEAEKDGSQLCQVILGWTSKNIAAVNDVAATMSGSGPATEPPSDKASAPSESERKTTIPSQIIIPPQIIISPEAADFE